MPAVSTQLNAFLPLARPSEPARPVARPSEPARPGWFARALHTFQEARLRQAEREVARFIEARGGRMTDALERQIERRFV